MVINSHTPNTQDTSYIPIFIRNSQLTFDKRCSEGRDLELVCVHVHVCVCVCVCFFKIFDFWHQLVQPI